MRKVLIISLAVILFMSCAKTENIAVQGIQLNVADQDTVNLYFDTEAEEQASNSTAVYATILPFNASNINISWASQDPSIVKVETDEKNTCILTPVSAGTTTITVTTEDGQKTASCAVRIENKLVRIKKFTISESELIMKVGDMKELTTTITPEYADQTVTWTSSDENIVALTGEKAMFGDEEKHIDGRIEAKAGGTVIIKAVTKVGAKSKTCKITVVSDEYVDEYNITHDKVMVGDLAWSTVNCGYHAEQFPYGKLFQWGRKDGQAQDEYEEVTISKDEKITLAKAKANTFYTKWNNTIATDEAWNTDAENYEENNPCPMGWRLPTESEMKALINSGKANLVLAGNRDTVGMAHSANLGTMGYYWTSTVSGENAKAYVFNNGGDYESYKALYRALGCSVRCVREIE